jgi:hypothetical protein
VDYMYYLDFMADLFQPSPPPSRQMMNADQTVILHRMLQGFIEKIFSPCCCYFVKSSQHIVQTVHVQSMFIPGIPDIPCPVVPCKICTVMSLPIHSYRYVDHRIPPYIAMYSMYICIIHTCTYCHLYSYVRFCLSEQQVNTFLGGKAIDSTS